MTETDPQADSSLTGFAEPALLVTQHTAQFALQRMRWIITLASLSVTTVVAVLPIYATQLKASGIEIGGLYAVSAFTTAISRPVIGRALDTYGRKRFLVLGAALLIVAMLLFAFARNTLMLFAANFTHGFGLGTMLLAAYAMTSDLALEAGRGSSFGTTEESQYRGGLYGVILAIPILLFLGFDIRGELVITPQAWMFTFLLFTVGGLIALWIAWFHIEETHHIVLQSTGEEHQKISKHILTVLLVVLLTSASAYSISPFILRYIQDHVTQNVALIGLSYAPSSILLGILPSRFGKLSDRFGRKLPMAFGLGASAILSLFIPAVSLIALPTMTTILLLAFFATFESVCYSAAVPAEQALIADLTGEKKRGTAFGLYTLSQAGGKVIGSLLMGGLYDILREGPFIVNAIILVIGSLLVLFAINDPKSAQKKAAV